MCLHSLLLLITIFSCISYNSLYAQELGFPFIKNYSPKQYNAHAQNWDIAQDARGIMYFGNGDGVLEYDGTYFRHIKIAQSQTPRSLCIGKDGVIYIGSVGAFGYLRIDSMGNEKFVNLAEQLTEKDKVFKDVWETLEAQDGIYFRANIRLFRLNADKTITVWQGATDNSFRNTFVLDNQLFVRTDKEGLLTVKGKELVPANGSNEFKNFGFTYTNKENNKGEVLLFARAARNRPNYRGLLFYRPSLVYQDTSFIKKIPTEVDSLVANNTVYSANNLQNGNVVAGTLSAEIVVLNQEGKKLFQINQQNTDIQSGAFYKLFTDTEKNTWVATGKGVSRINFQSPITFWNDKNSGLKDVVESTVKYKGKLYVSTHRGIFVLDKNNQFQPIPSFREQCWTLLPFYTPTDTLLLAGTSAGVFEIKDDKGIPLRQADINAAFELYQSRVFPNRLYVCMGLGFTAMEYENGKWKNLPLFKDFTDDIRSVQEDDEKNLWLGSFRGGIYKVTLSDSFAQPKQIINYKEKDGIPSLKNILVFRFKNRLIFGTEKGLIQFNAAQNKFEYVTDLPKELTQRNVFSLIEDPKGNVWASGLFNKEGEIAVCIKTATGYVYTAHPFKPIPEMMALSFWVEGDNILWIGGSEGLYRVDKQLFEAPKSFYTHIRRITTKADSVLFGGAYYQEITSPYVGKTLISSLAQPASLKYELPYQYNSLVFEYSAATYIDESATLYSHQLEGYDKEWSAWTKDAKKEYTNLREGKYIFKVKAKNLYGQESAVCTYEFSVLPPWYRAWWAYLFYVALGVGFVVLVVRLNTQRLKAEKVRLEEIVLKRTEEVRLKNAELEQQKEEIQSQAESLRTANEDILLKNVELEQQKEEIEAQAENLREANDEIQKQSVEVQKAYNNIQTISEIGQKVTASLDLSTIIQLVYNNVNLLMDASCFGIGVYQADTNQLLFQGFIENGETLPTHYENLDTEEKTLAGTCFKERQPLFVNDLAKEIIFYGIELKAQEGALPKSLIYLPLTIEDKTVGVITVQSFQRNAYQETDIDLLAALASYISIALENANSYEIIKDNNKHITDSIRYGKTIQEALLPDTTEMKDLLGDYFVYYKPKDVVSGDFYWVATTQRGVMIAVVDCTGHGVPGAFMSMIGMSLLHEAVNQRHIESPADILEYLNNEIRNSLKQTTTTNRDGMDVCLCRIERTETANHVTFAGAKRNLYYVEQGELAELKGNRKNIGGLQKTEKVFSNQYITVAKDTMLYLTTDGYTDQANKEREKFGILTLLDLLKQIAALSTQEQLAALTNAMELHQQTTQQRDDMTILGIKI